MTPSTTQAAAQYVSTGPATVADIYTEIRRYDKEKSPIVMMDARKYPVVPAIMEIGGFGTVTANEFFIYEDEPEPLQFTPASNTGVATTITLANAYARMLVPGDTFAVDGIWYDGSSAYTVPTAGASPAICRVISLGTPGASNTTITISNPSNTAITTSMTLIMTGSAMQDGWRAGDGFNIELSSRYQYVQNFSRVYGWDDNRANELTFDDSEKDRIAMKKRQSFNRQLGYAVHLNRLRKETLAGGQQRRLFGGMQEFIPSGNFTRLNGPITLAWMNSMSASWFDAGSEEKYAFPGPAAATYIANKQIPQLVKNDELSERIGIPGIRTLELQHGTLHLMTDWSFQGLRMTYGMPIYDLDYLKIKTLMGMDIQLKENIQPADAHYKKHEIFGAVTLHRTFPEAHHIVYDILG